MVVTHLFQILAFMAMEPPTALEPGPISEEKNKVFRSLRPLDVTKVVRGQYEGYRDIPGVAPDSDTETFVALRCEIDNWRWAGVPFFLRTGKQLGGGERIISIAFREPPKSMFPDGSGVGTQGPDHLTFDLADSSKLSLSFYGKKPGPGMKLEKLSLQFALHETGQDADVLEAYERLIHDAMIGDHTLFNTAEGIERLWEVSTPLLEDPPPVQPYAKGSWGPDGDQRADRAPPLAPALRAPLAGEPRLPDSGPAPGVGHQLRHRVGVGAHGPPRRRSRRRRAARAGSARRPGRARRCSARRWPGAPGPVARAKSQACTSSSMDRMPRPTSAGSSPGPSVTMPSMPRAAPSLEHGLGQVGDAGLERRVRRPARPCTPTQPPRRDERAGTGARSAGPRRTWRTASAPSRRQGPSAAARAGTRRATPRPR